MVPFLLMRYSVAPSFQSTTSSSSSVSTSWAAFNFFSSSFSFVSKPWASASFAECFPEHQHSFSALFWCSYRSRGVSAPSLAGCRNVDATESIGWFSTLHLAGCRNVSTTVSHRRGDVVVVIVKKAPCCLLWQPIDSRHQTDPKMQWSSPW